MKKKAKRRGKRKSDWWDLRLLLLSAWSGYHLSPDAPVRIEVSQVKTDVLCVFSLFLVCSVLKKRPDGMEKADRYNGWGRRIRTVRTGWFVAEARWLICGTGSSTAKYKSEGSPRSCGETSWEILMRKDSEKGVMRQVESHVALLVPTVTRPEHLQTSNSRNVTYFDVSHFQLSIGLFPFLTHKHSSLKCFLNVT